MKKSTIKKKYIIYPLGLGVLGLAFVAGGHARVNADDSATTDVLQPMPSGFHAPQFFDKELTEEQRANLDEIHQLVEEGKLDEAKELRQEAGLPEPRGGLGMHFGGMMGGGFAFGPEVDNEAVANALESGDYEAWKLAILDARAEEVEEFATQEHFDQMVEIHQLVKDGKQDEARQLLHELHPDMGRRVMFRAEGPAGEQGAGTGGQEQPAQ